MVDVQKGFESLQQDITLRYHDKVLVQVRERTSPSVRKSLPDDLDLLRTEVTALIHLEKYVEALEALPGNPAFDFERGYLMYKLGRFEQTAGVCEGKQEVKFQHLGAQAVYLGSTTNWATSGKLSVCTKTWPPRRATTRPHW